MGKSWKEQSLLWNHVDHLLVEVLGVLMKKAQILTENQASIFQCNIVPRKAELVPEYLPEEITNGSRLHKSRVFGTVQALVEQCVPYLRKTLRNWKGVGQEPREIKGLKNIIYNEKL